jgi:serine protease Do
MLQPAPALANTGAPPSLFQQTIQQVQPKIVKIYGAGGFQEMEPYQTGMLISPEGHILTVFSYVLDTDALSVTLSDGRKFTAKLLGADPRLEVAVLKIDATGLSCFELDQAVAAEIGQRVLAFSNLFGVAAGNEPVSVQRGVVSVKTHLQARRGVFATPYDGPVYVIDAVTNNPGAAGGALVTQRGRLVAMLGRELRNTRDDTWLNYAVPIDQLRDAVDRIRAGTPAAPPEQEPEKAPQQPLTLEQLGIILVPDVMDRTPPYVDEVRPGTPAATAGIHSDDLLIMVNQQLVRSCGALGDELARIDRESPVRLTIARGQDLVEVELKAQQPQASPSP